jgi:hypothetical protein
MKKVFKLKKSVQKQLNQTNEQLPKKQYRAKKMKSIAKQSEIEKKCKIFQTKQNQFNIN